MNDLFVELFPSKKPAVEEGPEPSEPAPKKLKGRKLPPIKMPPAEDKLSKPCGSDRSQRASRGDALTFSGPPQDPVLREQFLSIREEYMDQKALLKAEKGKNKKSEANWTPHASQAECLKFMRNEMAKLQDKP